MGERKAVSQLEIPVRGKLMTVKEVSEEFNLRVSWIYDRLEDKKKPCPFSYFHPSPRIYLFDSADIYDWFKSIKHQAGSKPGKIKEAAM